MTEHPSERDGEGVTRRKLVVRGAGLGALALIPGGLAACGGGGDSKTTTGAKISSGDGTPVRGGRLRVATPGAGSQEVVHPFNGSTPADVNRRFNIFDSLFRSDTPDSGFKPYLAESAEPNGDATVWTIKLRSGVMTHTGRELNADDAIYSLRAYADLKAGAQGSPFDGHIDFKKGFKKVDDHTFEMHFNKPIGDISQMARDTGSVIAPVDWNKNPKKPVGTGPFEFVSFSPGERSLFKRNPNYWVSGKPYVDELEIISIPDGSARASALRAGEVDAVENLDFLQAKQFKNDSSIQVFAAPSEWTIPFLVSGVKDPFKSVEARQAMKYAVDRKVTTDTTFAGFGNIANDQFGKNGPDTFYNKELPQREYDPEKAKALLAKAGYANGIDVAINLGPNCGCQGPEGAAVKAAQAYQQQAKAAGINFEIKTTANVDGYDVLKFPFSMTWWSPGVPFVLGWFLSSHAPNTEGGWNDPAWDKLYFDALGASDPAKAKGYWDEVQSQFYERSGHIIWGNHDLIDGLGKKVRGAYPNTWPLSTYDFKSYWFAA